MPGKANRCASRAPPCVSNPRRARRIALHHHGPAQSPHRAYPVIGGLMTSKGRGTAAQSVIRRLDALRPLPDASVGYLERLIADRIRHANTNADLVSEGHRVESV